MEGFTVNISQIFIFSLHFSILYFSVFEKLIFDLCLQLFSGSDDATVRVWDLLAKKCVATLDKHFSTVTSMAITSDGSTLISAGRDKARLNLLFIFFAKMPLFADFACLVASMLYIWKISVCIYLYFSFL